eukprot:1190242-Prorocentrum_minimum.AAC.2
MRLRGDRSTQIQPFTRPGDEAADRRPEHATSNGGAHLRWEGRGRLVTSQDVRRVKRGRGTTRDKGRLRANTEPARSGIASGSASGV